MSAPGRQHRAAAVGDEAGLYRDLQPRLLGLLRSTLTARVQTLEDACSFAWVQLIRTQPDRAPSVFGWLYVTARHEALRLVAVERRTPALGQRPKSLECLRRALAGPVLRRRSEGEQAAVPHRLEVSLARLIRVPSCWRTAATGGPSGSTGASATSSTGRSRMQCPPGSAA